jgi:hypothetical protein
MMVRLPILADWNAKDSGAAGPNERAARRRGSDWCTHGHGLAVGEATQFGGPGVPPFRRLEPPRSCHRTCPAIVSIAALIVPAR